MRKRRFYLLLWIFGIILTSLFMATVTLSAVRSASHTQILPSVEAQSAQTILYFPLIFKNSDSRYFESTDAWVSDAFGEIQDIFFLGGTLQFQSIGNNYLGEVAAAQIIWQLDGPCGLSEIFSDTVDLPHGPWTHAFTLTAPICEGSYIATAKIATQNYSATHQTDFTIHFSSAVIVSTDQAFDRCNLPTIDQMKTWWDDSPYMAFNVYLGGIHFPCSLENLTTSWLQAAAQQGWDFIFTWVGPQAACSNFIHKMSADPNVAFQQGISQAAAALQAASSLGISGEKIIYYDLEAYSAPAGELTACRTAADSFIQGWTHWLKLQGDKAGVYGSPCNSYMVDWANNNPPPDDVWIAHWLLPAKYRANATVWDVACMSNSFWPNNQRLRQYAGDHAETWGNLGMTIDSNILAGEITTVAAFDAPAAVTPQVETQAGVIRQIKLVSPEIGYLLRDQTILKTEDGGNQWRQISPDLGESTLLDMNFVDSNLGWFLAKRVLPGFNDFLAIHRTQNGGHTWKFYTLPIDATSITAGTLDFVDAQTGWLLLELESGSSFSFGRLFITRNGGQTWEERGAPVGEQVKFIDQRRGWMLGGPPGDQLYRTDDGAKTWQPENIPEQPAASVFVGLPEFVDSQFGVLPVMVSGETQSSLLVYTTSDRGDTWVLAENMDFASEGLTDAPLPISLTDERWWTASPDGSEIMSSSVGDIGMERRDPLGLPPGTISFDFASEKFGWALVSGGICTGEKAPAGRELPSGSTPLTCSSGTRLFATADGGQTWEIIEL